jgi:hypothetical protein
LDEESPLKALFAMGALVLWAAPVFGAPPSNDGASAQLFFERGRDAAAAGDTATACKNFEESLRLEVAVGTLFNLAQCEEKLGQLASAWQHLREGVDRLDPGDPRVPPARKAADALAPRIPKLRVVLSLAASAAPVRVRRDGVELTGLSLSEPLPVNPGKHTVVVECEGYEPNRYDVELAEGEAKTLPVELGKQSAVVAVKSGPAVPGPAPVEASPLRTVGWIGVVAGGVSLAAGLATGALAYERSRVVDDKCDAARICEPEGSAALKSAQRYGTVSTVTTLVGLGLLGTGVVLLLVAKPSMSRALLHFTEVRF